MIRPFLFRVGWSKRHLKFQISTALTLTHGPASAPHEEIKPPRILRFTSWLHGEENLRRWTEKGEEAPSMRSKIT
jgi:hypothetical protein